MSPSNGQQQQQQNDASSFGEDYTYAELEREPYWPESPLRISITGAGGFIASHIARRLKGEGHYIIASDWKKNEHMTEDMFCHEFHLVDLRVMDNCLAVTKGVDHVFNLAADMGGMGFIQSNHSVIFYNNTMISFNMLEAARINGVKRSACVHLSLFGPSFLSVSSICVWLSCATRIGCDPCFAPPCD
jgi:GDP-D-mannose 3',5'-epimerase